MSRIFVILFTICLTLFLVVLFPGYSLAKQNMIITLNAKQLSLDPAPILERGRVLVPLRAFCTSLGAEVVWLNRTVVIRKGNSRIVLRMRPDNTAEVYRNGELVFLDVNKAPRLVKGRIFVPVRFLSEALGMNVVWEATSKTASITKSEKQETEGKDHPSMELYKLYQPFERYARLMLRVVERGLDIDDHHLVLDSRWVDFTGGGTKEQAKLMAAPLGPGLQEIFWLPVYLVYRNPLTREIEVIELEGNIQELNKRNINIEWLGFEGKGTLKIVITINVPVPERQLRIQHQLEFNHKTGRFELLSMVNGRRVLFGKM
jgi:hypothetical protein